MPGTAKGLMVALAVILAAVAAEATEQRPDKIVVDGSAPLDLPPYEVMKTPLWEALRSPEIAGRLRQRGDGSTCTNLYRGYVATWEVRDAKLFLAEVRTANCGMGDPIPLMALFPGSAVPVPATWFSGELVVPRPSDGADPRDEIWKLTGQHQYIRVEKGMVTSSRIAPPNPEYRPCMFVLCVGDRVFFPSRGAELTPEAARQLARWLVWMNRFPNDLLEIEGHADKSEGDAQQLSEERARNAERYLIQQGMDERRLKVVAYGSSRPVAVGNTEEAFAQNRRAVAVLHGS